MKDQISLNWASNDKVTTWWNDLHCEQDSQSLGTAHQTRHLTTARATVLQDRGGAQLDPSHRCKCDFYITQENTERFCSFNNVKDFFKKKQSFKKTSNSSPTSAFQLGDFGLKFKHSFIFWTRFNEHRPLNPLLMILFASTPRAQVDRAPWNNCVTPQGLSERTLVTPTKVETPKKDVRWKIRHHFKVDRFHEMCARQAGNAL